MATSEDDGDGTRWEGYADYQRVSIRIGKSIDDALDAYAELDSRHQEAARIPPAVAAEARSSILSAAMRLVPELEADRAVDDTPYDEILARWQGTGDRPGFLQRLNETQLQEECPSWLFQMTLDIRTAGWHLGYLQAGRTESNRDENDPKVQVNDMLG